MLNKKWLGNVEAYSMIDVDKSSDINNDGILTFQEFNNELNKNHLRVIAEIKGKKYIYCNVPIPEWDEFKNRLNVFFSRGEKFHQYIVKYKCDCIAETVRNGSKIYHTLKKGETLAHLGYKYYGEAYNGGLKIKKLNPKVVNWNSLQIGQKLRVR